MRKDPLQDSQCSHQHDYLSSPIISVLTLKVVGILVIILGTACTLALTSKPQQSSPNPKSPIQNLKSLVNPLKDTTSPRYSNPIFRRGSRTLLNGECSGFVPMISDDRTPARILVEDNPKFKIANLKSGDPVDSSLNINTLVITNRLSHQNHTLAEVMSQTQLAQEQPAQQVVETEPKQNQQESAPKGREVRLTLFDTVILAIQNNRQLKNVYLERIAQKQDLAVEESKFLPNFTPTVSVSIGQSGFGRITSNGGVGAGATVSVKVPTGGELNFTWAVNGQTSDPNGFAIDTNGDIFEPNLQLSFNQPLLRGAGINLNRASIDIARLSEKVNILNLKSTLIDTITTTIFAYRKLLQAQEQLKIEQQSLELAQQILEVNRVLIEAGRVAPVDIVQSQTAVANRQVSLLTAQNNLEATKLALINILDIDQTVNIVAAEPLIAKPITLNSKKLMQLAFENRPDYFRAQLNQKISQLQLLLAEDDKRWNLNLVTSLNNTVNNNSDARAGLVLSREFGDLTKEQRFVRTQVNLLQAENTLKDLDDSIKIQVTNTIRDVNLRFSQVERARQATVLSQRQLDIEREKQRLGKSSGIFELVRLQNDLVLARNAELDATIEYLNALTRLDQILGMTLETWQVTLDRK